MAGLKRKSGGAAAPDVKSKSKKLRVEKSATKPNHKRDLAVREAKPAKKSKTEDESEPLIESDTSEDDNGFYGFSANEGEVMDVDSSDASDDDSKKKSKSKKAKTEKSEKPERRGKHHKGLTRYDELKRLEGPPKDSTLGALNATSSKEAHAKQKELAKERKAAKPNADIIGRSKKIWERLRLKSHIEKEERAKLLDELFEIITGRVNDFVFKHDSVRVIQCALKYSRIEQKKMIALELKGEYKALAESRYAKFLIAKLLEAGDSEIRDMIVSEFYGHVRQLINHPEAAWILDDTYRTVATPKQKARLLREWYGAEFSIRGLAADEPTTADLPAILDESPEKRKPIMDNLGNQINTMIQKKLTGFTMLHDAMLQYFLACKSGSTEAESFLDHLKPDTTLKEGEEADNVDLLKNLAFTRSGSRLMSLAFAHGGAKERKIYLKPYKDTIELMSYDQYAHNVLLAAMAVTDDTRLTSKSILGELLPGGDKLEEQVLTLVNDIRARTIILYPFAGDAKWLLAEGDSSKRLAELYAIRSTTSKKDPNTRLQELARTIISPLLDVIIARAADFATTSFGCQFMAEVLLGVPEAEPAKRKEALQVVANVAAELSESEVGLTGQRMRMFKTLVQGGKFDSQTKKVVLVEPALGFADMFWEQIEGDLEKWATGDGSFVIVGLLESQDFKGQDKVLKVLKKHRKALEAAATAPKAAAESKESKSGKRKSDKPQGNAGARILLTKL